MQQPGESHTQKSPTQISDKSKRPCEDQKWRSLWVSTGSRHDSASSLSLARSRSKLLHWTLQEFSCNIFIITSNLSLSTREIPGPRKLVRRWFSPLDWKMSASQRHQRLCYDAIKRFSLDRHRQPAHHHLCYQLGQQNADQTASRSSWEPIHNSWRLFTNKERK